MSQRRFIVLAAVLGVGILASFFLGRLGNPFVSAGFRDLKVPFTEFPRRVGEWVGEDDPLTPTELKIAGLDRYLRRRYTAPDGRQALLYLAYYGNKDRGIAAIYHNPTVCFPAAGWEWARSDQRPVTLTDVARQFTVSLDTFRKPGEEVVVLNFFVIDGEILEKPPRNKPFWIALDKFTPSSDPGYFLQAQVVTVGGDGGNSAADQAVDFLEDVGRFVFRHF